MTFCISLVCSLTPTSSHGVCKKGDGLKNATFRGLKILDHIMIVTERVWENTIREVLNIDPVQYGFASDNGIFYVIFIVGNSEILV